MGHRIEAGVVFYGVTLRQFASLKASFQKSFTFFILVLILVFSSSLGFRTEIAIKHRVFRPLTNTFSKW